MSAPLHGQVVVSASAQALSAAVVACNAFSIKAPQTNGHAVYVGGSGVTVSNGYQLDAGDSIDYELKFQNGMPAYQLRPSDFYVVGTAGDAICWLATP